jgi:RNA polymerase sigma-70 factor (ECF subfamily)
MVTEEFERLYAEHAGPLLAFLEYRTGNLELAKDVHADTFERVLRTRVRWNPRKASQKTWLYSIALNVLRDHGRRRGAEARAYERMSAGSVPADWEDEADRRESRDALLRAMAQLPDDEREAVALFYGADLSVEEIARVAGTRAGAIKQRLYRARERMRETLGENG